MLSVGVGRPDRTRRVPWPQSVRRGGLVLPLAFILGSCIYLNEQGIPEHTTLDYAGMGEEGEKRAAAYIDKAYADQPRLPSSHPLSERAQMILGRLLAVSEPNRASIGGYVQLREKLRNILISSTLNLDDSEYCGPIFEYFDEQWVSITIVGDGRPQARAFPNNTIFLHRGLVDPDGPYAAATDAELAGVLAHELAHLRDGHVFWQWALARSQAATTTRLILSVATQLLPIRYGYTPGGLYKDADGFDRSIEFDADIAAMELMTKAGYDPYAYIAQLERLARFAADYPNQISEPADQIHYRARCAKLRIANSEETHWFEDIDHSSPYEICRAASLHLEPQVADRVVTWVREGIVLEDLRNRLDKASFERLVDALTPRLEPTDPLIDRLYKCDSMSFPSLDPSAP